MQKLKAHQIADCFPPMSDNELAALTEDIREHGLRETIVLLDGKILDGRHRYKACLAAGVEPRTRDWRKSDGEPLSMTVSTNLRRRHMSESQRAMVANKLATLRKGTNQHSPIGESKTQAEAAELVNVSKRTVERARQVAERCAPETVEAVERGEMTINKALEKQKSVDRASARAAAASGAPTDERIIIGDFAACSDAVADGSVSLIFTDPPYDKKSSAMLPELGRFASAKLAEGGSLLCYVGQTQIPSAIDALREHLRYWWVIACLHSGGPTIMREYGIKAQWKAVLWFVKGTRDDKTTLVNDVMSGGKDKQHHEWGQPESEAAYWIERLCPDDGIVCDPFLGGGTTAVVAEKLGRKWIGFEIDPDTAACAAKRVAR